MYYIIIIVLQLYYNDWLIWWAVNDDYSRCVYIPIYIGATLKIALPRVKYHTDVVMYCI